jgi:hypothetical protein
MEEKENRKDGITQETTNKDRRKENNGMTKGAEQKKEQE